jgi:glycine/D-amino acid oxidase-like deaminating enzyme
MARRSTWDLAVIGGGIVGVMTALMARRRHPEWRIVVVDRSLLGAGATLYSAFMEFPYGATPGKRDMAARSARLYAELGRDIQGLPLSPVALLGICSRETVDEVQRCLVGGSGAAISPVEQGAIPAPSWLRTRPGDLRIEGLRASRCTDGSSLVSRIADALFTNEAAACLEGVEVTAIEPTGDALELRRRDGRTLSAARVAVCIGPWIASRTPLLAGRTFQRVVRTKKVVSLHLPITPQEGSPLIYAFDHEAFFLPQAEHRRWLFSFRADEWDCAPEVSALSIEARDWAIARRILDELVGDPRANDLGGRVFCDAYTADGEPLVARVDGLPSTVVVTGSSGSGFRLAPAMAERAIATLEGAVVA